MTKKVTTRYGVGLRNDATGALDILASQLTESVEDAARNAVLYGFIGREIQGQQEEIKSAMDALWEDPYAAPGGIKRYLDEEDTYSVLVVQRVQTETVELNGQTSEMALSVPEPPG